MKLWSQLARLGAAVAALAPAVAEAGDDHGQVEILMLDPDSQPVAAASIGGESVGPDANPYQEVTIGLNLFVAAVPAALQLPPQPGEGTPGPPRGRPQAGDKPHVRVLPHGKSWHRGGQRYGG